MWRELPIAFHHVWTSHLKPVWNWYTSFLFLLPHPCKPNNSTNKGQVWVQDCLTKQRVPWSELLLRTGTHSEAPNFFLPGTPKQITLLERHPRILTASQSLTWSRCRISCWVSGIVCPTQKLLKTGELPQKNRQVWQLNIIVPRDTTERETSI